MFCRLNLIIILLAAALESQAALVSNAIEPNQYFIGREQFLKQIEEYFSEQEIIVSLTGVSGIGKTQIARKYAYDHFDDYKIVWIINCKRDIFIQIQELAKNINDIICKNDRRCQINEDPKKLFQSLRMFIKNQDNWLLIFDNFNRNENLGITEIFEDIGKEGKKNIIITSRSKDGLTNIIPITPFSEEESYKLARRILKNKMNVDNHRQIIQLINSLHHYPLALNKVSKFLSKNNLISITELKIMLAKNSKIADKFCTDDLALCESSSIETILNVMLKGLSEESLEILFYAILLDNHNLSKNFLYDIYSINNSDKESVKIRFLNALWELNNNSLLEYKTRIKMKDKSEVVLEMHDFLQEKLKSLVNEDELKTKLRELLQKVEKILPNNMNNFNDLQNHYPYIISNLEALLDNFKTWDVNDIDVLRLRRRLLLIYSYNLDYKKLKNTNEWLDSSMSLFDLTNSEIKRIIAEFLIYRGQYSDFMDDDSELAINYYKNALNLLVGTKEENYLVFFDLNTVLAQTLVDAGQLKEAKKQLSVSNKILEEHPEIKDKSFYYFVRAYVSVAAGEMEEAVLYMEKLELVSKDIPRDVFTAPIYILKTEILNIQGRYQEGYETIKPICDMLKSKFEQGHELFARALKELAVSELQLGMVEESYKSIDKAEKLLLLHNKNFISEERTKNYSYDLGIFYQVKGDIFFSKKDYQKARDYYEQSFKIFQRRYSTIEVEKMSQLITSLAKTEILLGNQFAFKIYLNEHQKHFGLHHKRTKELLKVSIN